MNQKVESSKLNEFIQLREIEGVSDKWLYYIRLFVATYLDYVQWKIDKQKTLQYLTLIKKKYSITSYRKRVYQIRKFLIFLHIDLANEINPPSEPHYLPKRIVIDDIKNTLLSFESHEFYKQIKALILLGSSLGLRAEELYQLVAGDIELENRVVHVNHNPVNNQSTKTKRSRISFFNKEAEQALCEYLAFYKESKQLRCLFNQYHLERIFRENSI